MTRASLQKIFCALFLTAAFLSASVSADPPDHAKAHGWRKKHDAHYVGYTGREWDRDYGVIEGHCDRKAIGTVLGGIVGGVIGSRVGEGDNRTVAIIVGSVLGAAIGRHIGRELDESDRACIGHALELAKPGQSVRWLNDVSGVTYVVTPLTAASKNGSCRDFTLVAMAGGKKENSKQRACRKDAGAWSVQD
ncbi:MAG TPA: RT0821/Lpp0805 family surface protein [Steroidobacteraceae bacterium]|jgi:surface antigen|nr:RT0821/Lpp0805 family surface protein [Steroidobacteraceae bacterium]